MSGKGKVIKHFVKFGIRLGKKCPITCPIMSLIYTLEVKRQYKFLRLKARIYRHLFHPDKLRINVGAGHWCKRGWKAMDFISDWYSENAVFIDYYYDLTKRYKMPFNDNEVELFYSSHTLEHISKEDSEFTLGEIYRCLKPSGAVRITLPDMDLIYNRYKKES